MVYFDYWACPRQMTKHWGCPDIYNRLIKEVGQPDIVFGKTDGISNGVITVDIDPRTRPSIVCDWKEMPMLKTNQGSLGFWDPPYDKVYKKEYSEIWRVCKRLAILHQLIMPKPLNCNRTHMIAVTTGPYQRIRCLQIFEKKNRLLLDLK